MIDKLGRDITYLRISLTDKCNLRCRYCMPAEGVCKRTHQEMMNEDEVVAAVEVAAALGIRKIRLTGGEPLVKKNIVSICRRVAAVEGIREVCLTTNGLLLPQLAPELRAAGVKRINLSLDTLDPEKYAYITRIGQLDQFRAGLKAALDAGFEKVKINAVLIGGFNDDEIEALAGLTREYPVDMRFIELMPIQDHDEFGESAYVPSPVFWKSCRMPFPWRRTAAWRSSTGSPVRWATSASSAPSTPISAANATACGSPPTESSSPACTARWNIPSRD